MVVREVQGNVVSLVHEKTVAYNCSIFRGEGELGAVFTTVLQAGEPYAGVLYVETLVNPMTGQILEVLRPSPTRIYEREVLNNAGQRITLPVTLSASNPGARLAVFIVDAQSSHAVVDVIARDEILPDARACLRESIEAFRTFSGPRQRAA